jgi:hypothetical protein
VTGRATVNCLRKNMADFSCHEVRGVGHGRLDLGSRVRIPNKAWMFVVVLLCCIVVSGQRPWGGLITCLRRHPKCLNRFIISEVILK